MVTLSLGPGVLGAGLLAECLKHCGEGSRGLRRELAVELRSASPVPGKPDPAVGEVVIAVAVGLGGLALHFLGEAGQVGQVSSGRGGVEQDYIGVLTVLLRQPVGPLADLARPRHRNGAGRQFAVHGRVSREAPRPADRDGSR